MYLGKMIEVTREAPANLGTAMKTIIARFEDMKKDPNALIDGASANKVESALATIGIALRDTAGEFRPLQDVITELGMKWESLTRNQQAYIATVAAGSRQQSRFLAMMNDFDRTMELVEESQNSAGAAARQYATYQDSAAAATARLTAAWEEFYTKIVNSEQIIWVIDKLKELVEVMSKIGPVASAIGASLAALSGQMIIKGISSSLTKSLANAATTGKALSISLSGILSKGGALIITFGKLVGILGIVAAVIYAGVEAWKAWDKHVNSEKYEIKELTDEIKNLNEIIGKSSEKVKSLEDLMERYDELTKKIYRTKEEQEELNEVINQIGTVSKRAAVIIDENGEAHLKNSESVKKEIEAEKELIKSKADKKYDKTQKLLSKNNLTADQAREIGMEDYADALEKATNDNIDRYNKLNEIKNKEYERSLFKGSSGKQRLDELESSDLISERFKELSSDNEFSKYLWKLGYGDFGEIKSISDLKANVHKFGNANMEENYQKAAEKIYDFMIEEFDEDFQDSLKIIEDSDLLEKEKENQRNKALEEYFSEISSYDESASAFFNLMSNGLKFSGDQLNEVKENYKQYYNDNKKAIDEYLSSDRNQEDINKLVEALKGTEGVITESLINYAEKAKEAAEEALKNRGLERAEFWKNNIRNLDPELKKKLFPEGIIKGAGEFQNNDNISSLDLASLETALKLNISDDSKVKLFNYIVQDENDEFQKLGEKYINSLASGITKESDKIREELKVKLISIMGLSDEEAEKYLDDLVPNYKELLEERIDEDLSNYNTTRKGAADLTKLKSKERKQFLADNEDASKYFEYNEDGEEYLNILGKITLLEQQRNRIQNDINEKIALSRVEIEKNEKAIADILNDEKKSGEEKEKGVKYLQEQNRSLQESIELYDKQLSYINKTSNLHDYESMALQSNLNEAKKASDNIETIAEVWAKYQSSTSESYTDLMNQLNALDSSYQSLFATIDERGNQTLTLNQQIVDQMVAGEKDKYEAWRTGQIEQLQGEIDLAESRAQILQNYLDAKGTSEEFAAKEAVIQAVTEANGENKAASDGYEKGLINNANFYNEMSEQAREYFSQVENWAKVVYANIANPNDINLDPIKPIDAGDFKATGNVKFEDIDIRTEDEQEFTRQVEEALAGLNYQIAIDKAAIAKLGDLSPEFQKTYSKAMADAVKGGGKEAEKALKSLEKAAEDLTDALEDLDKLLKDIRRDLKDITIDYNPFTDLFEAWEAEWDYYYNIKNLIKQLDTQSTFIDNVISADYTSAQEKLNAYDAKVGNITGKIAANDAYITTLRAGIAKQAKELESEFNQYYNVDNRMGGWQIFQRDTTLSDWEKTINEVKKYSFELSKLINTQENELNLLEANQQALEQERSAYESILSTVDSLIDSLGNNEDITVDLSELEGIKVELQAAIDDESVENIKEQVRNLNDYIQELNIKLDLNDNVVEKGLEEGYERLKDEIDDLQDLIDTLNEKIAEQQELLQQLSEIYTMYVDTAIDTQQELYDAIVEQYQDEINEKKKHYDYLKQLDNDYLKAVKDNIDKERKAREDANKQQDFQKNLQRAQLLQQDTSGAYRNELANLNKEIENQRQDLYDDLVDKQVEALEKEIEKRHELYDLEVSAMEERLAYMQENAILLWEMVNDIVSRGSEEMMATLENTTDYINQNELAKERQRRQWELNTQTTYKGVIEGEIDMLQRRIDKAKEELDAYEELQDAIELSTATYSESQAILQQENVEFQQVMNEFMQVWTTMTSDLTGYNESWAVTLSNIKMAMEKDIQALDAMGDEGGSIFLLNDKLKQLANKMYDEFIEERRRYKDSITATINNVEAEITAAINKAANKISNINPVINNITPKDNGGAGTTLTSGINPTDSGAGGPTKEPAKKYKIQVEFSGQKTTGGKVTIHKLLDGFTSPEEAIAAAEAYIEKMAKQLKLMSWGKGQLNPVAYKQGGFADFTGPAWLDGTKSNPERILSPRQTKLFESMVSSLERTTANNSNINSALGSSYNIGDINTNINVEKLDNETDIDRVARQVENRIMKSIRNRVVVSVA